MSLFRFLPAALLVIGVLPCGAQSLPPQSSAPLSLGIAGMEGSPCIAALEPKAPGQTALPKKPCVEANKGRASVMKQFMTEKNSACYAIRDYQFGIPKDSEVPKLKHYSTCVPAARFEARNVTVPVTMVQAANTKR